MDPAAFSSRDRPEAQAKQLNALRSRVATLEAAAGGGTSGVSSFNGMVGAVVLALADVTAALGFTPQPAGSYAAATHAHAIANVTGLQAALDAKQVAGSYALSSDLTWANIASKPATFAPSAHTHPISDVTGLQAALDGKQVAGSYAGTSAATGSASGLMSAADKTKLDGIATSATANATDAQLRDRSTHTGTQAAATITGLGSAALVASSTFLAAASNLSDVANAVTARSNLGLGSAATSASSAFAAATHTHAYTDVVSVPTGSLLYRKTAATGPAEMQTLATLKADLGLTGTNSGDQTITLTGDVTGSGAGSFATAIGANKVTRAMLAAAAGATILGATGAGNVADLTAAQAKTFLAIAEADVASLTTDLAAKAPLASPQFTGVAYYQQPAPTAKTTTGTLAIADLLTLIITATSTTAVSLTLPTGTLTDAGILGGALAVNEAFEWYLINLGSSSGATTLVAGTGHTLVGNAVTAISTSSRWLTRKTATNTFITYRIA